MKNENFTLSPMRDYNPPKYPTRTDKPMTALKLPARWAKNTAMLACIGALSLGALAGCRAQTATPPAPASCYDGTHGVAAQLYAGVERGFDVRVSAHFGGAASGPFYVAYLTEQEALGIIRNRLCEAGICFDAPVPDYVVTVEADIFNPSARLALFDGRTRQGIVFPASEWCFSLFWSMTRQEIEDALKQEFAERYNLSATFIRNPGRSIGDYDWDGSGDFDWDFEPEFSDEEKQELAPLLKQDLLRQVDAFIYRLLSEGILPPGGAGS